MANIVVENLDTQLQFTIDGDDICKPCNRFHNFQCTDSLSSIEGYTTKNTYNQVIDKRLITQLKIDINVMYTFLDFIKVLVNHKHIIFTVWIEENNELTNKRDRFYQNGLKKIMDKISMM